MSPTRILLPVCGLLGMLGLPVGVFLTALFLEEERFLLWAGLGVGLLVGAIVFLELAPQTRTNTVGGESRETNQPKVSGHWPTAIEALLLQGLTILLFAGLLDGGVHLRACCFAYLGYSAGALLVLAKRRKALTKGDRLYLKWGWVPIIVIGIPLFVRIWKAKGLL